eukprot:scaffold67230_cov30-Tisochrysis_lutea.AAC.1
MHVLLLASLTLSSESSLLRQRIAAIEAADARDTGLVASSRLSVPVVCIDPMLPKQRMEIKTEDDTFCCLLRDVGFGGLIGIVGLDTRTRRLRRHGILARIAFVDVLPPPPGSPPLIPTEVRASLIGIRRMCVCGPAEGMRLRVGRFRRGYADGVIDGGIALGFGEERFNNAREGCSVCENVSSASAVDPSGQMPSTEVTEATVEVLIDPDELWEDELVGENNLSFTSEDPLDGCDAGAMSEDSSLISAPTKAQALSILLDLWLELIRKQETLVRSDVALCARLTPDVLISHVLDDIGPKPPTSAPTALSLWGASLINPLPSLGVAPECRGSVLEAVDSAERLAIVTRACERSIRSLRDGSPLI